MSNNENMFNFTALYTSYLRFTFTTNEMHATPCAYGIFTSPQLSSTNLCCFELRAKEGRRNYWSCAERLGQAGSSSVYMQK